MGKSKTGYRFEAYEIALEIIRGLAEVLPRIRKHDRDLEKQGRRAAASLALNLKEGNRRLGRDKVHLFSVAAGSADEVLEVSEAFGYVRAGDTQGLRRLLDSQLAILWTLTHR